MFRRKKKSPRGLCCYMTLFMTLMKKTFVQVRLFQRSHIGVTADNAAIMLPPAISISLQPSVFVQLNPEILWHQTWACGQISSCCYLSGHYSCFIFLKILGWVPTHRGCTAAAASEQKESPLFQSAHCWLYQHRWAPYCGPFHLTLSVCSVWTLEMHKQCIE